MKRHPDPNSRDWEQIAEDLQQTADSLPPGDDKQAAEQKLQRTKRAVEIRNWLSRHACGRLANWYWPPTASIH